MSFVDNEMLANAERTIDSMRRDLVDTQMELHRMKSIVDPQKQEIKSLQLKLERSESDAKNWKHQFERMERDYRQVIVERDSIKQKSKDVTARASLTDTQRIGDIEKLSEKIAQLETDLKVEKEKNASLSSWNNDRISSSENEKENSNNSQDDFSLNSNNLKMDNNSQQQQQQQQHSFYSGTASTSTQQLFILQTENDSLKSRVRGYENKIAQLQGNVLSQQTQIKEQQDQIRKQIYGLSSPSSSSSNQNNNNASVNILERNSASNIINRHAVEIGTYENMRAELRKTQSDERRVRNQYEELQRVHALLQNSVRSLRLQCEHLLSDNGSLERQLMQTRTSRDLLKHHVDSVIQTSRGSVLGSSAISSPSPSSSLSTTAATQASQSSSSSPKKFGATSYSSQLSRYALERDATALTLAKEFDTAFYAMSLEYATGVSRLEQEQLRLMFTIAMDRATILENQLAVAANQRIESDSEISKLKRALTRALGEEANLNNMLISSGSLSRNSPSRNINNNSATTRSVSPSSQRNDNNQQKQENNNSYLSPSVARSVSEYQPSEQRESDDWRPLPLLIAHNKIRDKLESQLKKEHEETTRAKMDSELSNLKADGRVEDMISLSRKHFVEFSKNIKQEMYEASSAAVRASINGKRADETQDKLEKSEKQTEILIDQNEELQLKVSDKSDEIKSGLEVSDALSRAVLEGASNTMQQVQHALAASMKILGQLISTNLYPYFDENNCRQLLDSLKFPSSSSSSSKYQSNTTTANIGNRSDSELSSLASSDNNNYFNNNDNNAVLPSSLPSLVMKLKTIDLNSTTPQEIFMLFSKMRQVVETDTNHISERWKDTSEKLSQSLTRFELEHVETQTRFTIEKDRLVALVSVGSGFMNSAIKNNNNNMISNRTAPPPPQMQIVSDLDTNNNNDSSLPSSIALPSMDSPSGKLFLAQAQASLQMSPTNSNASTPRENQTSSPTTSSLLSRAVGGGDQQQQLTPRNQQRYGPSSSASASSTFATRRNQSQPPSFISSSANLFNDDNAYSPSQQQQQQQNANMMSSASGNNNNPKQQQQQSSSIDGISHRLFHSFSHGVLMSFTSSILHQKRELSKQFQDTLYDLVSKFSRMKRDSTYLLDIVPIRKERDAALHELSSANRATFDLLESRKELDSKIMELSKDLEQQRQLRSNENETIKTLQMEIGTQKERVLRMETEATELRFALHQRHKDESSKESVVVATLSQQQRTLMQRAQDLERDKMNMEMTLVNNHTEMRELQKKVREFEKENNELKENLRKKDIELEMRESRILELIQECNIVGEHAENYKMQLQQESLKLQQTTIQHDEWKATAQDLQRRIDVDENLMKEVLGGGGGSGGGGKTPNWMTGSNATTSNVSSPFSGGGGNFSSSAGDFVNQQRSNNNNNNKDNVNISNDSSQQQQQHELQPDLQQKQREIVMVNSVEHQAMKNAEQSLVDLTLEKTKIEARLDCAREEGVRSVGELRRAWDKKFKELQLKEFLLHEQQARLDTFCDSLQERMAFATNSEREQRLKCDMLEHINTELRKMSGMFLKRVKRQREALRGWEKLQMARCDPVEYPKNNRATQTLASDLLLTASSAASGFLGVATSSSGSSGGNRRSRGFSRVIGGKAGLTAGEEVEGEENNNNSNGKFDPNKQRTSIAEQARGRDFFTLLLEAWDSCRSKSMAGIPCHIILMASVCAMFSFFFGMYMRGCHCPLE